MALGAAKFHLPSPDARNPIPEDPQREHGVYGTRGHDTLYANYLFTCISCDVDSSKRRFLFLIKSIVRVMIPPLAEDSGSNANGTGAS